MGLSQVSKMKSDSPIFKDLIQKNEKPPSEFGSGGYGNTEVGEESTSFVVYSVRLQWLRNYFFK